MYPHPVYRGYSYCSRILGGCRQNCLRLWMVTGNWLRVTRELTLNRYIYVPKPAPVYSIWGFATLQITVIRFKFNVVIAVYIPHYMLPLTHTLPLPYTATVTHCCLLLCVVVSMYHCIYTLIALTIGTGTDTRFYVYVVSYMLPLTYTNKRYRNRYGYLFQSLLKQR